MRVEVRAQYGILAAATVLMWALDVSGTASIPWWVVVLPVALPVVWWLFLSGLAVALTVGAYFIDRAAARRGRR